MIEGGVQLAGGFSLVNWQERIVIDPEIHHGTPCVRGTRVPVSVVLGSLAQGLTPEQVIQEYPTLCEDDIRACLAYAVEMIQSGELLIPLGA
ncbi:MAG: DUF433 domain-containing protein [candidate division KSB1 bacterium]|nr:DUF433 domain-containing protein [candidate division KSB1 bacterium]